MLDSDLEQLISIMLNTFMASIPIAHTHTHTDEYAERKPKKKKTILNL